MSDSPAVTQRIAEAGVEPDGIDAPTLLMWGFVSVVVVIAVILGTAALFYGVQSSFDAQRVVAPVYFDSEQVIDDQRGVLASYGPPASEGKPYRIPIQEAKKLVLADYDAAKD